MTSMVILSSVLLCAAGASDAAPAGDKPGTDETAAQWQTDYATGMRIARTTNRMMLVYFFDPRDEAQQRQVDERLAANGRVRELIRGFVLTKVPISAKGTVGGEEITLLEHPSFEDLNRRSGLAIIDLAEPSRKTYGFVVSEYPLVRGRALPASELAELLSLPPGTLTQRTLIFAVRTHPERPRSAWASFSPILADETENHSVYQARITNQGHHHWGSRFHRINARMPSGMVAQEVCAESWPGQGLLEAARECVSSWRHSSGHWSAVRGRQSFFAYDMKRGRNGVWYATGIFARR